MNFTGRVGQACCACAAKEQTISARHSRIRFMNSSYQRGLGAFAALVVIAIAVVAGYYVYKGVTGGGEAPTCDGSFTACMQICRRTSRCSITRGSGRGWPAWSRTGTASRDLLLWNFCPLHHPAPALRFADEELAQLLGRAGAALDAELGEALLHLGRRQRTHHRPVEALDDRTRRLRGRSSSASTGRW